MKELPRAGAVFQTVELVSRTVYKCIQVVYKCIQVDSHMGIKLAETVQFLGTYSPTKLQQSQRKRSQHFYVRFQSVGAHSYFFRSQAINITLYD